MSNIVKSKVSTPMEVNKVKEAYIKEIEERKLEADKKQELIDEITQINIGDMFFYGYYRNRPEKVILIEDITMKNEKHNGHKYVSFTVHYRDWEQGGQKWSDDIDTMSLSDAGSRLKSKLTKHPMQAFKEAEDALASGDIAKYKLDMDEIREAEGPDTQVMHLGSKAALDAVHKDLEVRRNNAEMIMDAMNLIIAKRKADLERQLGAVMQDMQTAIKQFEKKIKKIFRVITTLELYLGIDEQIVQILEGPHAPAEDPICIRQSLMFMDEEFGDPYDDGQGIEWKNLSAFGDWLVRNGNYKKVLPETKCIAAFKARRNPKERTGNPYWTAQMKEVDEFTFLVMRNGDNIYRLITDKIEFYPRLFPKRKELQQLFELWKMADSAEDKEREADRKAKEKEKAAEGFKKVDVVEKKEEEEDYSDTSLHLGDRWDENSILRKKFTEIEAHKVSSKTGEIKEYAEDHVFFYKMRFTLFQGIIERTQIFQPMLEPIKLFEKDALDKGLVRLIYDDELTLPSGKMSFWEWMKSLNDKLDYGSRVILSHNWGFISAFRKSDGNRGDTYDDAKAARSGRLDDRYGDGKNFSNLPDDPQPGMYFVKKGERWRREPVWIDNPFFNPDWPETKPDDEYCPEYRLKDAPKEKGTGYYPRYNGMKSDAQYHIELNPSIRMSYADQIKYYGKVVEKNTWNREGENMGDLHGVWKNPRKIHKYTMVPKLEWRGHKQVDTGEFRPEFEYHDVKYNFMCIRYNPKDKIERVGWTWKWDAEERKMNLSWKITKDDAFIINYDEIKIEDIDFYLNSRVDRRHYLHMMPLLWEVRKHLITERQSEVDFKKLVQGQVLKITGTMPTDTQVDAACEDWKKNLKWKRAIEHDDEKALRMIVQKLSKLVSKK